MIKYIDQTRRNKLAVALAIVLLTFAFIAAISPRVSAQSRTADDEAIQQSLEDQGLDEQPERLEFQESTMGGQERSSGFVDENGDPISKEEWDEIRQREEEGLIRQPVFYITVLLIGLVGVGYLVYRKSRK